MQRKTFRRVLTVAQNSLNNLLAPIFGIMHSALVIRLASPELWGGFVGVMIVIQFGAHLASWGNKEYLLREFSRHPDQIAQQWQMSLFTRLLLAVGLCLLLVFFGYSLKQTVLVALWGLVLVIAQSYEVIILFRRDFVFATLLKAVMAFSVAFYLILVNESLNVDGLILVFTLSAVVEAGVYRWHYRDLTHHLAPSVNLHYFKWAASFFLLGFSGLLASRIDLYAVSYFLPQTEVGHYQVFINLMLYVQAISAFIIAPYTKGIYRLSDDAIAKISIRLFTLGAVIIIPALSAAYGLLWVVYGIRYSADYFLFGGAFVLPIYGYVPLVYRFYKLNRTGIVLRASLGGAGINLALNFVLLPRLGAVGAMLASAIVQWGILAYYVIESREVYAPVTTKMSSSV